MKRLIVSILLLTLFSISLAIAGTGGYEKFALYDEITFKEGQMIGQTTSKQWEQYRVYDEVLTPETTMAKEPMEAETFYSDFRLYDEIERR